MSRSLRCSALTVAALLPLIGHAAPVFSGDVAADFTEDRVLTFPDPAGVDVGVPIAFPAGTISGNDVADVRLFYDAVTDRLYIGINTYGIATDVDGDGDPDRSSPTLTALGGVDEPLVGGTESFAFFADLDEDGVLDVIAGVPAGADASGYVVAQFAGTPVAPGVSFGAPLAPVHQGSLFAAPSAATPDLEFTIESFSTLPTSSGAPVGFDFSMGMFVGSLSDAGIGEDFFPGVFQFTPVDVSSCGDGLLDPGELCDDGNTLDGDGCSSVCDVEPGFECECAGGDALSFALSGASGLIGGTTDAFLGVTECPEGELLVGLTGTFIDNCPGAIASMDLLCGPAAIDPTTGDVVVSPQGTTPGLSTDPSGIDLPLGTYTLTCPPDQAVVGLVGESGILNPFNPIRAAGVSELQLRCADLQVVNGRIELAPSTVEGTPVAEGNPVPGDTDVSCAPGELATAIGGWGRFLIDGARLACSTAAAGCGDEPSVCRELDVCGDGIAEGPEACDDGNTVDTDGCRNDCTLPFCGDGLLDPGEACDDGNTDDLDACSNACVPAACGDGVVQHGEACDDGNDVDTDACTNACTIAVCGDGITGPGELCDDGNTVDADGCRNDCTLPFCGDGVVDDGELCDDGNAADGDGCSSACEPEVCEQSTGVDWNFDLCRSFSNDGSNADYSELTPTFDVPCDNVTVTATNVYREQGNHSCTDDRFGSPGDALCTGVTYNPHTGVRVRDFVPDHPEAVRFAVTVSASAGSTTLGTLSFWQLAPDTYRFSAAGSSPVTGPNNPPKNYGVRILRDGVEVFRQVDVPTTSHWSQQTFDLASDPDFRVTAADGDVTFEVELLAYDHKGWNYSNGMYVTAWDLEDIRFDLACTGAACDAPPACGDGHLDPGELCDDGNAVDGDGCSSACEPEGCVPIGAVDGWRVSSYNGSRAIILFDAPGGGSLYLDDEDLFFLWNADGTAELFGTAIDRASSTPYEVDLRFTYRGLGPAGEGSGGPKIEQAAIQPTSVTDLWQYFDMTWGTLTKPTGSWYYLEQMPTDSVYPFQVGATANGKDADFGASGWFYWTKYSSSGSWIASETGDVNVDLDPIECVCGDGLVSPGEGCDDGNTHSGDGCSSSCTVE